MTLQNPGPVLCLVSPLHLLCVMDRLSHRALDLHLEDQEKQTLLSVSSCSSLFCFPLLYLFL